MTDPIILRHFEESLSWIRLCMEDAMRANDRGFGEKMTRELNSLNLKLANHFHFQIRTGVVRKIEKSITDG